ncbi:MAG TPA: murein biosynthesis integral membrane protein MurJ, partial [Acidimicrobiaceae bacterium]|nr:murein biosynthesis integral membrane protein MurJ [Acidimicrobiaceae bacterium]
MSGAGRAAAGIGLSRLTGVVRAMLVTNILGIGSVGDAFAAALRIPNVLQNLLGEGALSAAFVPAYAGLSDRDRAAAGRLAASVAAFLLAVTAVAVVVGVAAARPLTRLVAWGFVGERFELTVKLVRITVVGAGVLVVGAWCVGVLNTQGRTFLAYVAPVVWNAAQIAVAVAAVLLALDLADAATALAWAVTAGAGAQVLFSLAAVRRADPGIRLGPRPWLRRPDVAAVLRRLGPAVAGRGAFQISAFADLALASLLAVGATAALAAAQALYLLPVSLIGIAVAAADLPALSRLDDDRAVAAHTADRLASSSYLVCGVVALYLAAGVPLAGSLFNLAGLRNAVAADDITLIATVLGVYSLGLPALVASRLCQNELFAAGDTRTPARIAVVRVSLAAAVGVAAMLPLDRVLVVNGSFTGFSGLDVGDFSLLGDAVRNDPTLPARLGAVGLALGAAVGAWAELALVRRAVLARR